MVATASIPTRRQEEAPMRRPFDERQVQPRPNLSPLMRRTWNALTESYQTDEELWAWTGSWDL
jgi:hypothetical protein